LKLQQVAAIITVLVIVAGAVIISPLFFRHDQLQVEPKQVVMLSFTVSEADDVDEWCQNLSSILSSYNLPATIFIEGKIAEQNPQTVKCFGNKVDFGSLTYDNVNLTTIDDYSLKVWEVEQGKEAVDDSANTNSTIFQAPNGATDEDIFSILSSSGIIADFSYKDHFNIYRNGRFEKIVAEAADANDYSMEYLLKRQITASPLIIQFDNTWTTEQIDSFLSGLKAGSFDFVRSSQFLGLVQARGY
jgi:peptidoglycan/xylan/chitin deacetylase (PgdA/CDA1 family)